MDNLPMQPLIILLFIILIYLLVIRPLERRLSISELQHGQEIEVRSGGKWYAARYYCKMPFKKDHKVLVGNEITYVRQKDIKIVKQSKPMNVR